MSTSETVILGYFIVLTVIMIIGTAAIVLIDDLSIFKPKCKTCGFMHKRNQTVHHLCGACHCHIDKKGKL